MNNMSTSSPIYLREIEALEQNALLSLLAFGSVSGSGSASRSEADGNTQAATTATVVTEEGLSSSASSYYKRRIAQIQREHSSASAIAEEACTMLALPYYSRPPNSRIAKFQRESSATVASAAAVAEEDATSSSNSALILPYYRPPKRRIAKIQRESIADNTIIAVAEEEASSTSTGVGVVPVPVPTSLYSHGDEDHINPTHNILRRDILEIFIEGPPRHGMRSMSSKKIKGYSHKEDDSTSSSITTTSSSNSSSSSKTTKVRKCRFAGRIGLRCRFCKRLPYEERAPLSNIYPESLQGIYRATSIRFQKRHVEKCEYIPREIRDALRVLKDDNSRGSKSYWVESAVRIGLRNSEDGKGIVFRHGIES